MTYDSECELRVASCKQHMHIYIMSYGACGKFHFFVLAIFSSKVFSHLILSSRVIYTESVENIEDVGVK